MNGLVTRDVIRDLAAARTRFLNEVEDAQAMYQQALADLAEAKSRFNQVFYTSSPRFDITAEDAREKIDSSAWEHLIRALNLHQLMNAKQLAEFRDQLEDAPEFTEENIEATAQHMIGNRRQTFLEGLADTFSSLDKRFKSHDAFGIKSRLIFNGMYSGGYQHRLDQENKFIDVIKVFDLLDTQAKIANGEEAEARSEIHIRKMVYNFSYAPTWEAIETPYFRVRKFENGNLHAWIKRKDLLLEVNSLLAEFYGEVLPDAVTKERPLTTELAKDLQFYYTPELAGKKLTEDMHIGIQDVLEPNAGEGHLVRLLAAKGYAVDAIEVHPERVKKITGARKVVAANFLAVMPVAKYDAVVMNPPFYGTHWMDHVMHAFKFLKPFGELRTILPATAEFGESKKHKEFRRWMERSSCHTYWKALPTGSFKESGTNVSTVILYMRKPR